MEPIGSRAPLKRRARRKPGPWTRAKRAWWRGAASQKRAAQRGQRNWAAGARHCAGPAALSPPWRR
eukprot:1238056-Pyramimonas_sp.AAC.1